MCDAPRARIFVDPATDLEFAPMGYIVRQFLDVQ